MLGLSTALSFLSGSGTPVSGGAVIVPDEPYVPLKTLLIRATPAVLVEALILHQHRPSCPSPPPPAGTQTFPP